MESIFTLILINTMKKAGFCLHNSHQTKKEKNSSYSPLQDECNPVAELKCFKTTQHFFLSVLLHANVILCKRHIQVRHQIHPSTLLSHDIKVTGPSNKVFASKLRQPNLTKKILASED